nr:MAG: hypothetical protein [Owegonang virus 1]
MSALNVETVDTNATTQVQPDQVAGQQIPVMPSNSEEPRGLMPSGWKCILPVPMLLDRPKPLFIVRLSPYVFTSFGPNLALDDVGSSFVRRMFATPIQILGGPLGVANKDIKILYDHTPLPHFAHMLSHLKMSGQVDLVLRISSNTNITGSLSVSELHDVDRSIKPSEYILADKYQGYLMRNQIPNAIPAAVTNFALNDLSLTRHLEVSTSFSMGEKFYNHWWLQMNSNSAIENNQINDCFFRENILMVSAVTDITGDASQLTFNLYWDFSKVVYEDYICPLYPTIGYIASKYSDPPIDITSYYPPWTSEEDRNTSWFKRRWQSLKYSMIQ